MQTKRELTQLEKFREAAREHETDDSEERFDKIVKRIAKPQEAKVCPECGYVFQGNGWDGIDAHWRAKHEQIMPYVQAWPLISSGRYPSK